MFIRSKDMNFRANDDDIVEKLVSLTLQNEYCSEKHSK